jgi:hypothetical protein
MKPWISLVAGVLPIPPLFDPKFVMRIGSPAEFGLLKRLAMSNAAALAAEYLI